MKKIMLIITLAVSVIANAQVTGVSLKASGLTCSMCSNAINKALKKLDFVEKVDSDIKTYSFEISFKP
ncbi:MAG: copper chaperone, partial [Chitinophagaceae bacterium]